MGAGVIPIILLWAVAPAGAQCDAAARAAADGRRELHAWTARHKPGCPLCADGSVCRDAYDKRESLGRKLEAWKKKHSGECAACPTEKCTAEDLTTLAWTLDARERHKKECRRCDGDACEALKLALEEVRRRLEEWKRDHPGTCRKCAPGCELWRRGVHPLDQKYEEMGGKHKEQCGDCRRSLPCARPGSLRQEHERERLALWKRHADLCACAPRSVKRR